MQASLKIVKKHSSATGAAPTLRGRVSGLSGATPQKGWEDMHRTPSLALCITLVLTLLAVVPAHAQPGTVLTHQKISDTEGGFTGTLDDNDLFGVAVASLSDQDGDGVGDLAVGALADDDGGTDRGAVWVLFLNVDGTVKSHQKISDTEGGFTGILDLYDQFGISLAALGDLDGDGVGDLAVGATGDDDGGTGRGAVWVLFLNPDGTVKAHQKISDTEGGFTGILDHGDLFGSSVASVGDLDGDGVGDLAVGAENDDDGGTGRGAVWVLFLDGVPADCGNCPTDVDDNSETEAFDLANLLGAWGPVTPDSACLDDDGNGFIEAFDLAVLLGAWGPC